MTTHTDDSLGSIPALPCPFCGSSGLLETCPAESTQRELFWVECKGDNCGISGRIRYTANDAINAWNRRPAPAAAVRMPDQLIESVRGLLAWWDNPHVEHEAFIVANLAMWIDRIRAAVDVGAAAPVGGEATLSDRAKYYEECAVIAENTIVAEYEGVDCYGDKAADAIRRAAGVTRHG
jgi:Lar family restriction alleviation protein